MDHVSDGLRQMVSDPMFGAAALFTPEGRAKNEERIAARRAKRFGHGLNLGDSAPFYDAIMRLHGITNASCDENGATGEQLAEFIRYRLDEWTDSPDMFDGAVRVLALVALEDWHQSERRQMEVRK